MTSAQIKQVTRMGWSLLMLVLGLGGILLAVFLIGPVAVNWPDSWFGAVLIIICGGGGVAIVFVHTQRLWNLIPLQK